MKSFNQIDNSLKGAQKLDQANPLAAFRKQFAFPKRNNEQDCLYFAGHSLGLMPKKAREYVQTEFDSWEKYGVEGHFLGQHPWLPYHENLTRSFAKLVGAKETEVVAMNTLTVNLHLMMVSFYRPTKTRFKILIENNTFPSDHYAVSSQARFHGFDPKEAIIVLKPRAGEMTIRKEDLHQTIEDHKDSLALIMLGNCNYLSGQYFSIKDITQQGHEIGAMVGFNLAHGAGNLKLDLHQDDVDFAVWCTYKYLNSGPGSLAGAYIHERHHAQATIPRFEGWWGHDKQTRFKMGPEFKPIQSAEAWQLSNPPIFQLAAMRASLELFDQAGMANIRSCGDELTSYLEYLISQNLKDHCSIVTPPRNQRGSMLCLKFSKDPKAMVKNLHEQGVFCDFREPDIIRITPAPLYNSYSDVFELISLIEKYLKE
jgi:kynureninase